MADVDYTLHYRADNADMLAKNQQVITSLTAVDSLLTRIKNAVGSLYSGMSRSAGTAATRNQAVANSLNQVAAAAGQAQQAVTGLGSATANVRTTAGGASRSVGAMVGKMLLLRAFTETLSAISAHFKEIKEHTKDTADYVEKIRENSRELGSLMGKKGPGPRVTEAIVETSLKAGVTPEEATEFLTAYQGVASVGEEKHNITKDVSKQLATEGLRMARRLDINEHAAGEAIGMIPLLGKVGSKEEGMEQLAEAAYGIQAGKMQYTPGFKALGKLAPQIVGQNGGVRSYGEAGVLLGAYSQIAGSADQAQHMIIQTKRLLGETEGPKGEYLKSLGITPDMMLDEKLAKLAPHVTGANGEEVLAKIGFHAKREREVTIAAARNIKGIIQDRFALVRGRNDARESMAANEDYYQHDENALAHRADAAVAVSNIRQGQMVQPANTARKIAAARLYDLDPNFRGNANMSREKLMELVTLGAGGAMNQTIDLDKKYGVVPTLEREAKRLKVDLSKFPGLRSQVDGVRQQAIAGASREVQAAGGDPYGLNKLMEQQLIQSNRQTVALEKIANTRDAFATGRAMPMPPPRHDAPDGGPGRAGP